MRIENNCSCTQKAQISSSSKILLVKILNPQLYSILEVKGLYRTLILQKVGHSSKSKRSQSSDVTALHSVMTNLCIWPNKRSQHSPTDKLGSTPRLLIWRTSTSSWRHATSSYPNFVRCVGCLERFPCLNERTVICLPIWRTSTSSWRHSTSSYPNFVRCVRNKQTLHAL